MAVNKVEYGGETLIDLTNDTVTPDTLAEGVTAHGADGEQIVGTMSLNGGGSADTIVGTWKFNEIPNFAGVDFYFNFKAYNPFTGEYSLFDELYDDGDILAYANSIDYVPAFEEGAWTNEALRTIEILEEPTDTDFIAWLKANAVKQEESGTSNGFEMPQIRFASAIYYDTSKVVSAEMPLKLTVEIVGGGALQVGDKLQICSKRTYGYKNEDGNSYRKQKLRRQCEYEITEEDLDKRFLTITTDGVIDRWLFKNDRNRTVGTDSEVDTLSPFYMRIKRVTKYADGKECDAVFSNVVTVWKTYNNEAKKVNIK